MPGASLTACTPTLEDVIRAAPPLLELLSSASLKSLLCTSSGLRQIVQRHVRTLALPPKYPCDLDTEMLANHDWHQLELLDVSFNDLHATDFKQLQKDAYWPQLTRLDVSGNVLTYWALKHLSKLQCPKLNFLAVGHTHSVCQPAVEQLASNHWSMLRTLQLPRVDMKAGAMAKLAKAHWPQLQDLDLSDNEMDIDTIRHLAHGNWLQLTSLNLSGNCIEPAVANHLIKAPWPSLETLTLGVASLLQNLFPAFSMDNGPDCIYST